MYVNKCIKCGAEFETKNPKRVICPNCLYAEKGSESSDEKPMQSYSSYSSYSTESRPRSYDRPQQGGYRANNNYRIKYYYVTFVSLAEIVLICTFARCLYYICIRTNYNDVFTKVKSRIQKLIAIFASKIE